PLGDDMSAVSTDLFQQLRAAVGALHAAGIAHNDLHRSDILVSGGVPKVVDFAAALAMPGWLARSGFGRQLLRRDLAKRVQLQTRLAGTAPSPEDARVLVDPGWVRALRGTWTRLYRGATGLTSAAGGAGGVGECMAFFGAGAQSYRPGSARRSLKVRPHID